MTWKRASNFRRQRMEAAREGRQTTDVHQRVTQGSGAALLDCTTIGNERALGDLDSARRRDRLRSPARLQSHRDGKKDFRTFDLPRMLTLTACRSESGRLAALTNWSYCHHGALCRTAALPDEIAVAEI